MTPGIPRPTGLMSNSMVPSAKTRSARAALPVFKRIRPRGKPSVCRNSAFSPARQCRAVIGTRTGSAPLTTGRVDAKDAASVTHTRIFMRPEYGRGRLSVEQNVAGRTGALRSEKNRHNRPIPLRDYAPRPAHLKWLLDSGPTIRWQVMRDLTGESP